MQIEVPGEQFSSIEKEQYRECHLCPRDCGVNRLEGQTGYCGMGALPKAARAALHFWEEPCISGQNGSGAVFFAGCNLRCVFCQNREISCEKAGKELSAQRLAEIFLELQKQGAHNINLVTGVQFIPSIAQALRCAKGNGLVLPVVYNCGGYESVSALELLEGLVDIYLPDFKYMEEETAQKYSHARDYPQKAKAAFAEMYRQVSEADFDDTGMMRKGLLVRHLLLPGRRKEAEAILSYLYQTYGDNIYLSIMNQYTPMPFVGRECRELDRKVTSYEYDKTIEFALSLGITKAYMQTGKTAAESFIPPFDLKGIEKRNEEKS